MSDRKALDIRRDRGGSFNVGTEDDGAILEMYDMGGRILVIKENSIYELRFADQIDPKRENPKVPLNTQKLILPLGTKSEMCSRTFLTAKRLVEPEYFSINLDKNNVLALALEVTQELSALNSEITNYLDAERRACEEYQERRSKNADHATPSIPDLKTRCKTIFQKVDHVSQAQMEIIRLFFPEFGNQSYYRKFFEFIEQKFGGNDPFVGFIRNVLPFIELTRNIRNCLDHRRSEIQVKDFELQESSDILTPTIEIHHLQSDLDRTPLSVCLPIIKDNLVAIFETMIAYLCGRVIKSGQIWANRLLIIPEEQRINKFIKFAYWSPLGEGGYYHQ